MKFENSVDSDEAAHFEMHCLLSILLVVNAQVLLRFCRLFVFLSIFLLGALRMHHLIEVYIFSASFEILRSFLVSLKTKFG